MRVINKHYSSRYALKRSVYIGRPTKWGNPYPMPREALRDEVCDKYELYMATRLINGVVTQDDFNELQGKDLQCFCAPKRCHGDTILLLYNMTEQERMEWANAKISGVHS